MPAADLCETADAFIVTAELPGVPRPQIRIDVHDGQLTVHGRRDARVACEQYHQVERGHGEFSRSFRLPHTIVTERISAELKDGVLTIVVPKGDRRRARGASTSARVASVRRLSLALLFVLAGVAAGARALGADARADDAHAGRKSRPRPAGAASSRRAAAGPHRRPRLHRASPSRPSAP